MTQVMGPRGELTIFKKLIGQSIKLTHNNLSLSPYINEFIIFHLRIFYLFQIVVITEIHSGHGAENKRVKYFQL